MTNITTVPPWEGPVIYNLGINQYFNIYIEEGDDFKVLKFVVANLAQLSLALCRVRDLEKFLPHGVDGVVLKRVDHGLTSIEEGNLCLYRFFGRRSGA